MVKILILQILGLETVEFFGMRCFTLIRPEIENVRNEDVELIKMSFVILKVKRFLLETPPSDDDFTFSSALS